MDKVWLIAGDFNDITKIEENRGKILASNKRRKLFQERVNACSAMDI